MTVPSLVRYGLPTLAGIAGITAGLTFSTFPTVVSWNGAQTLGVAVFLAGSLVTIGSTVAVLRPRALRRPKIGLVQQQFTPLVEAEHYAQPTLDPLPSETPSLTANWG